MEAPIITLKHLVSEAQCYAAIRQLRWQDGVTCPHCDSRQTIRRGFADPQHHCQRYQCKACGKRFDDLTGTVLAGHHPGGSPAALAKMLEFADRHHIAPQIERFPMSQVNDALTHLQLGKARYRIVLEADFA